MRAALLAGLVLAGCYAPSIPNGTQKCAPGGRCADGYQCGPDGFCYQQGHLPPGDGGPRDLAAGDLAGADLASADRAVADLTGCGQCPPATPICDVATASCVECETRADCAAGICDGTHRCSCTSDADCGGALPRCDTASSRCVACLPMNDNCPPGQVCTPVNGAFQCLAGCKMDSDCKVDGGGGKPMCCGAVCADVAMDNANCGACGSACKGGQTCCSGGCTALSGDVSNCGACGNACAGKNASWSCTASTCHVASCNGGYSDCNTNPSDGCEVHTDADPANCGSCGKACSAPNGTAGCAAGACTVAGCNAGFANCNNQPNDGCEVNTTNNPSNCGGCGKVCTVANGSAGCAASACTVAACNPGFANCNGQVADGCEVNTTADNANCGKCGMQCPIGTACQGSMCVGVAQGCFKTTDVQQSGLDPNKPQYTSCQQVLNSGYTCVNPLVRYGNVPDGVPAKHMNDDFNAWCVQLGCKGYVANSVVYGNRDYNAPFGALFWCNAYDDTAYHWCDWLDGLWFNMSLGYHPAQDGNAIVQITCN